MLFLRQAQLASELLRAEGVSSLGQRVLERCQEARRRRSFESQISLHSPVLNLLGTPLARRFGGVQIQLFERLEAESEERPFALLYPHRGCYRVEVSYRGKRQALELPISREATPSSSRDLSLEDAVERAARLIGAQALHVENPQGLPVESLLHLRSMGYRLLLSIHDFYLFCSRPHLLERPSLRFCHFSQEQERCRRCLGQDHRVELSFQSAWRSRSLQGLLAAELLLYPSDFLCRQFQDLFPGLDPSRQRVVSPPSPGLEAHQALPLPSERAIRHLAFVGSVRPHKGAHLLEEIIAALEDCEVPDVRWSIYGAGETALLNRLRRLSRVRVRGYFRAASLPGILRRDRVDLVLLPSPVPESYGLIYDQCLRAGVPVVAFDHGALGQRIRRLGGGRLVAPQLGARGVADDLVDLVRGAVAMPPVSLAPGALTHARDAARAHLDIYRSLGLGGERLHEL